MSKQNLPRKTQNLLIIVNELKQFRKFLEMTFLNHAVSLVNDDIAYLCHLVQVFIALQYNHTRCYLDNSVFSPSSGNHPLCNVISKQLLPTNFFRKNGTSMAGDRQMNNNLFIVNNSLAVGYINTIISKKSNNEQKYMQNRKLEIYNLWTNQKHTTNNT